MATPPKAAAGAAYLAQVQQLSEQRRAEARAVAQARTEQLREAIRRWYASLPSNEARPRYSTAELCVLFAVTPQEMGPALFELGWIRKRDWRRAGPFRRWWHPPQVLRREPCKAPDTS
jgi:hypothetical protein